MKWDLWDKLYIQFVGKILSFQLFRHWITIKTTGSNIITNQNRVSKDALSAKTHVATRPYECVKTERQYFREVIIFRPKTKIPMKINNRKSRGRTSLTISLYLENKSVPTNGANVMMMRINDGSVQDLFDGRLAIFCVSDNLQRRRLEGTI